VTMPVRSRRLLSRFLMPLFLVVPLTAPGPAGATFPGDNGKIVFVLEGELYKVNPNGSGLTPVGDTGVQGFDPAVSPSGNRIAFARSEGMGPVHIYVVRMNGEDERQITGGPGFAQEPAWTPNGEALVFSRNTNDGGYDLFKVRPGPEPRRGHRLTHSPGFEFEPDVSSDGLIVFTYSVTKGDGDLIKLHLDGTHRRRITDTDKRLEQNPSWAPGGNKVAFSTVVPEMGATPDIASIQVDGTHRMRLIDRDKLSFNSPSWSPNGEWIAAIARNESFQGKIVRFRSNDGTPLRNVTTFKEAGSQPAWQPK
jgi:Tol biopolymer transport system component